VVRQSPSAGSEIPPGSTVSIVVSEGEAKAKVPNVIGKLRADAVAGLREAGLKPAVTEQETDVAAKVGKVTDQFPPPGSEVEPGSQVTVVVGKASPSPSPPPPVEEEAGEG
jgi:serine/threonine-protein kinase